VTAVSNNSKTAVATRCFLHFSYRIPYQLLGFKKATLTAELCFHVCASSDVRVLHIPFIEMLEHQTN